MLSGVLDILAAENAFCNVDQQVIGLNMFKKEAKDMAVFFLRGACG